MSLHLTAAFIAYFGILFTIAILSHKKSQSESDFVLGNRSLNFWVIALSAHASDMSSWLFMAFPGTIFAGGMPKAWMAVGLLLGMLAVWQVVAPKLRTITEEYDCDTLSSFFEKRFNDKSGTIRIVSAVMTLIFTTIYLSVGLISMGRILNLIFGINYTVGITIATLVVTAYTSYGGFITVAWTDLFQGLFLLFALMIVPVICFFQLDNGWSSIVAAAETQNLSLSLFSDFSSSKLFAILSLALWGLGYFGQPHILTKFMGIDNAKNIRKSKIVGISWLITALLSATFVALVGIAFFQDGLQNSEFVFVEMVKTLFHPLVGGFILCGILAAIISTMDSQIIVSASVLTEDLYKPLFMKGNEEYKVSKSRGAVFLTALFAYIIAFDNSSSILEAVEYAWTGLGCSFGPLVLMALHYPKANKAGAIAGIITGGVISGTWKMWAPYDISAMIPGFILALLAIYTVSKVTDKPQVRIV